MRASSSSFFRPRPVFAAVALGLATWLPSGPARANELCARLLGEVAHYLPPQAVETELGRQLRERGMVDRILAVLLDRPDFNPFEIPYASVQVRVTRPTQTLHNALVHTPLHQADTRVVLELPEGGKATVWSVLSPEGREYLVRSLLARFARGTYEKRRGPEIAADIGWAWSPLRYLVDANCGLACGECRLANANFAGLLGELGIPPGDIRLVYSKTHIWTEYRTSPDGPWREADATPRTGLGPSRAPTRAVYRGELHVVTNFLEPLDVAKGAHAADAWVELDGQRIGVRAQARRAADPAFRADVEKLPHSMFDEWYVYGREDVAALRGHSGASRLFATLDTVALRFPDAPGADPAKALGFSPRDEVLDLVRERRFPKATRFDFDQAGLEDADVASLVQMPGFADATMVRLRAGRDAPGKLTSASVVALDRLRRVRDLDLSWQPLESEGLERIIQSRELAASLVRLTLSHCRIGDDGVGRLAESPLLSRLELLDLSGNRIGPRAINKLLDAIEKLPRWILVDLRGVGLDDATKARIYSSDTLSARVRY